MTLSNRCWWRGRNPARYGDAEGGALTQGALNRESPAQGPENNVVANVQPQAAAALAQFGGEKGVENLADMLGTDALAVVRDRDVGPIPLALAGDGDEAGLSFLKAMRDGVHDQIGQHLPQGPRVAVHGNAGFQRPLQGDRPFGRQVGNDR